MYEFQRPKTLGYKLYQIGSWYEILSPERGKFRGNFEQVRHYASDILGFDSNEIRIAKEEMEKNFHNAAEFGVLKGFMFTFELTTNKTH